MSCSFIVARLSLCKMYATTSVNDGGPVLSRTRGVLNKLYNATVFSNNLSVVSIDGYTKWCRKSVENV